MNVRGIKKLCCPMCKGHLTLETIEKENIELQEKELSNKNCDSGTEEVIKEGLLICNNCKVWYPVSNYIPVMLVFTTSFHDHFAKQHNLKLVDGYTFP